jgi:uncharacterized membrane protein (DUF4010 family)
LFSTLTTVLLLAIVAAAVYMPVLPVIAPSIVGALVVAAGAALVSLRSKAETTHADLPKGRAFNLLHGVGFAVALTVITAIVAFANTQFGQLAVGISTAFAGFFDVHAASASVFALAAGQKVAVAEVLMPMLLAFTTNTISKAVGAYLGGGIAYASRVSAGLTLVLLAAWAPLLWLG